MNGFKRFSCLAAILALILVAGCAAKRPPQADWVYPKQVTIEEIKPLITVPNPEGVVIIDSRPYETKHVQGYIPTTKSIPTSKFDGMTDQLPKDKKTRLIFYCEGWECKLSHQSAFKAERLGYQNVQVFGGGYPEWVAEGEIPAIGVERLKEMMGKGDPFLLVDSRPAVKYAEGSIPGAVSIPDSAFDKFSGMLPRGKNVPLVFFCGGFDCPLSHKSAAKAKALGYKKIMIAEAGYPAWVKLYGAGAAAPAKSKADDGAMDATAFQKIIKENPKSIMLIDVRDEAEFKAGHLPTAVNIPVDQLEKKAATLPKDKPIVFICATGARSGEAYYMMKDVRPDLKDVHYLEATTKFRKDGTCDITPNKK